jgi:hypothetical protein
MIGVKWMPSPNILGLLEYHYVDGTLWLNAQDNPSAQQPFARYWDIIAASESYRF